MKNQVVLITGASSGIGKAAAIYLMKKGCRVYGTSRKAENRFNEGNTADDPKSGGFIRMIPLDVTSDPSVDMAMKMVISHEGRIDILICNAGFGIAGSIEDTSMDEAKAQFETNFFGTLRTVQAVLPFMRKQKSGKIIIISSVAGFISIPFQGHYSASKFAVEGLVEALRHEIAPFGIKACIVEPGDTKTEFTGNRITALASGEHSPYFKRFQKSLRRMEHDEENGASPVDVAHVIYKMIKIKNPPVRKTVGFQYKAVYFLKRLLPTRFVEKIVGLLYSS